jgi:hypothetical protein
VRRALAISTPDFGKRGFGLVTELVDGALHVAQVGPAVAGFVLAQGGIDVLDDRLGVPFGWPPVPVVQPNFAAKVKHQGFKRGRGFELEAHLVQFLFGRGQVGPEALQVFHQHQRVLLLFKKPDRHEGREVAVVLVVSQEHFSCRQGRPLGDGVHLDGLGLLVRQLGRIERLPRECPCPCPIGQTQVA